MKRLPAGGALVLILALLLSSLPVAAADTVNIADTFTIPAGTQIEARLTTTLSSKTNQEGDPFMAQMQDPIFFKGEEVIPAGSMIEGRIAFVRPPGRVKGVAEIRLVPEKITTKDGVSYTVSANLQQAEGGSNVTLKDNEGTLQGKSGKSVKTTAKDAGIGAGVGAAGGVLLDGGTGALYGMAIGAVVGTARAVLKHNKDIVVPSGTDLTFMINRAATATRAAKNGSAPLVVPDAN